MINYQEIIDELYLEVQEMPVKGKVASYIPELAKMDPGEFGVCLTTVKGESYAAGNYLWSFSIQSIAKVFALSLAFPKLGDKLWERVDVEPSGTGFNSLVQLETGNGIPRNPFNNGGAMVICDALLSIFEDPSAVLIQLIRDLCGNNSVSFSEAISNSEKISGYRNIAICNFIKSFGNIHNEPHEVLDFYYRMCSVEMNCQDLSKAFLYLADENFHTRNNERILSLSQAKRVNAIMQTCGFYDESGEFAFKVGLPGKSGVGGGIVAVHPDKYCIAVWSPPLNEKGNSEKGMKFLEEFTTRTKSSIF